MLYSVHVIAENENFHFSIDGKELAEALNIGTKAWQTFRDDYDDLKVVILDEDGKELTTIGW